MHISFIKAINTWLDTNHHRFSPHTYKAYLADTLDFFTFLRGHNDEISDFSALEKKLTPQDIRSWLTDRLNRSVSNRSNARAVSSLKSFFQYLCDEKIISKNIFHKIRPQRIQKSLPRPLTQSQAIDLIQTIHQLSDKDWIGLRDRALFSLIYSVGLRISEALQLNQGDITEDNLLIMGKGQKQRYVPLIDMVKQNIEVYLNICPHPLSKELPLFYSVRGKRMSTSAADKTIAEFRRLNNLPDTLTPHALRHSCATHLVAETSDLRSVQELLGHASLSTTQIYTQVDQERLMHMYDQFKPRD